MIVKHAQLLGKLYLGFANFFHEHASAKQPLRLNLCRGILMVIYPNFLSLLAEIRHNRRHVHGNVCVQ